MKEKEPTWLKWVKASERLPIYEPNNRDYNLKVNDKALHGYYNGSGLFITHEGHFRKNDVEWLDEKAEEPALTEQILQELGEKEVMIQAFAKIRKMFEMREWIMEGRGSYPYNDDRYKEEVRYLFDECDAIANDTWANIKTKTYEYREKIIKDYLKKVEAEEPAGQMGNGDMVVYMPVDGISVPTRFTTGEYEYFTTECKMTWLKKTTLKELL